MRSYLILFLFLATGFVSAQSYAFLQWTVADGLPAADVTAIAQDAAGFLWVGTNGGGVARFDGLAFESFSTAEGLGDNFVTAISATSGGEVLVKTNTGVARLLKVANKFQGADAGASARFPNGPSPRFLRNFDDLLPAGVKSTSYLLDISPDNNLIGTTDGLYLTDGSAAISGHYTAPSNLPGTRVRALFKDRQHRIWVATTGGLARMVPSGLTFYPSEKITALHPDNNGGLWLGTGRSGIRRFTDSTGFTRPPIEDPTRGSEITTITEDNTRHLYFSTAQKGIVVLNDSLGVERLTIRSGLPSGRLLSVIPADSGRVYAISADRRIARINYADSILQVENVANNIPRSSGVLTTAISAPDGEVIVANTKGALHFWHPHNKIRSSEVGAGLPAAPITAMTLRGETQLWVAVAGHGLFYTDLRMDQLQFFPLPSRFGSIPSTILRVFAPEGRPEIWLGTDRNLVRIYLDDDGRPDWFRFYGKAEGFPVASTLTAVAGEDDRLWFGTSKGLVGLTPDDTDGYLAPPPTTLESISLFYEPLAETDYTLENGRPFFAATNNHFNFRFRAVDLTYPERVRYQWRLKGSEKEWSPLADETAVRYAGLPPGTYEFMVRATTDGGKTWGDAAVYAFTVGSPLWRKPWFIGLLTGLAILALIGGFYTFYQSIQRSEARKRQALEAQNQLLTLEQKALQLQMNPHFIFNALNGIRGLVDGNNNAEARRQISRFAKLMRGILNNSRRETIPLSEEISTLTEYLEMERFCQPFDFTYTISPPENVDPEEVNIPSMLLQPFLENAVLHGLSSLEARSGHISVGFVIRGRGMQCTVTDNGSGRSAAAKRRASRPTGHQSVALDVTRARLKTMKGRMDISDVVASDGVVAGTRVELFFPVESW